MGMSASQARLLSLTSRLHDVELKAQNLEAQKIALATQKDEVYERYCDALDATKIQVAFRGDDAKKNFVDANFTSVCTYQEDRFRDYAIRDNKSGKLIVSAEMKENYDKYSQDKYSFAWAMLGYKDAPSDTYGDMSYIGWVDDTLHVGDDSNKNIMTPIEESVYEANKDKGTPKLSDLYTEIKEAETNADRKEAITVFRDALYQVCKNELAAAMKNSDQGNTLMNREWDNDVDKEFNYYCRIWEAINQAGGCVEMPVQYEDGEQGCEWFQNMVEAGVITILENKNTKGGTLAEWSDTSVATSTNGNFLSSTEDTKGLKKAEAEYEHELSIINRKDSKFDTELSKLETERTAITTEIESISKVRDDNIDRTFGIFS